jgi:TetR/AcrR family transcriptional repressor of nem operon
MKERLMEAAMDLMWQNSYGAASVDAICERAGQKREAFTISSSQIRARRRRSGGGLEEKESEMDSIFHQPIPPLERFDRYFDFVYERLGEVQKKCGSILGCPFMSVGSEVSTQDQIVREAIDRIMDRKLQFFVSAVRDARLRE